MRSLVVAVSLVPAVAGAEPGPLPFEIAVRAGGIATLASDGGDIMRGAFAEFEVGARVLPALSLLAFARYARAPDTGDGNNEADFGVSFSDGRFRIYDVGVRGRWHFGGPFVEAGIAWEKLDDGYVVDNDGTHYPPPSYGAQVDKHGGPAFEGAGGYERALSGCRCEVSVFAGLTAGEQVVVRAGVGIGL
jgi:hypothetical protein